MKRSSSLLFTALLLAHPALSSAQIVMDFSSQYAFPNQANIIISPLAEDGLVLSHSGNFQMWGSSTNHNTGHKAVQNGYNNTPIWLTMQNGALFQVLSMRLSPFYPGVSASVTFTGNLPGGGTVTATFDTGGLIGGVVCNFPPSFTNLASVSWQTTALTLHQFDDITVMPGPTISAPAAMTVNEAAGDAVVSLSLSESNPVAPVTVAYTLTSGTAVSGTDFTVPAGGTLTIPAGQRSASLNIPITNDTTVESLEDFTVTFTAGQSRVTTVKIASDDGIANFAAWMSAHGLTGNAALPNADPNGDTVPNIESWLHRINPAGPSPAAWLGRRASYFTTAANVPSLRLTIPTPLPSDVRLIFEETTALSTWSEQTRRSGFATGSLWTGTGASRVVEANTLAARTITFPGSATRSARPHAYYRMKYELVSTGND